MLNIDKEQLEQSHRMFVAEGYEGNLDQFSELMKNNPAALNDMFGLYVEAGYRDSKDAYAELIGAKPPKTVKKKVVTESNGEDGSLDSSETDGSPIQNPTEAELENLLKAPKTQVQEPTGMYPDNIAEVDAYREQEITTAGEEFDVLKAQNEIYQKQRPEDMAIFLAEEQERKNLEEEQRKNNLLIQQQSDPFLQDLSVINTELIKQDEETAIALLRGKFLKYGFSFEKTGMGDAIIVSNFDGTATETIDLQPFMSSSEVLESKKLKDFITNNAKQEYQENEFEDLAFQSDKAQNLRIAPRINEDGTESTVLMTDYEANGRFYAIPTLFPKDPSFYGSRPEDWLELDFEEAKKLAEERGEVFEFETAEQAAKFAEGSWKDTHATNVIGKQLYSEAGLNFAAEDDKYQQYLKARDTRIFLDEQVNDLGRDLISELTPEEKELYGGYYVNGVLRDDAAQVAKEQREIENKLYLEVNTEEKIKLREEFDLKTHEKYEALSQKAAKENRQLLFAQDELEVLSLKEFGVPVKDLNNVVPADEIQAKLIDDLRIQTKSINVERQHAADLYETAKTFYSAKYDKSITKDMEDGAAAVYKELRAGLNDGNASEVILQLSTGMPFDFQNLDINNEEDVKKAAEMISALKGKNQGRKQSRQLSRWNRATGFRESLDAFNANPFETAFVMAINSIGMMLPYGAELVAAGTVAGGGIGAGVGAAGGVGVGAVPGAIFGMRQGMKTGMAMTSFAMEYTNEFFAAMEDKGLDVLNPQDVVKAINDPEIWATAKERGIARGVPIALVDFITAGAAGRVFKVGKTASRTKKVVSQVAERLVVDPLAEMTGEGLAQISVGDELDFKEIAAEGIGGFGNNTSSMIVNKVMDIKKMSKIELASKLTEIDFIVQELSQESDTRVSAWTNNMLELGQINADQAQRIQKNLGLSKDADNMLDFGIDKNSEKNTLVKTRLMQLLSAKEEYSADTNRREVFGQKIKDINAEIAFLIENKKLAPENIKAKIEAVFSPGVETTDTRAALSQYVIDGKTYSRSEFLKKLGRMNARQLTEFNGKVANDKEVTKILNEKLDGVQIRETESVDARQQATIGTGVGTEVSIGGLDFQENTELETTETEGGIEFTEQVASPIQEVAPTTKPETIVAVAPFFDTTIESAEQAQTLRDSEGYQQYRNNLTGIGQQLGLEVEVEEGIGGYKNDAGTEIVEVSNRVVLKNATIEQAQEYAALAAALAPETQESSIAAEYVEEGSKNHNGNEYVLTVSDSQGVINALKKAGITDFSINEDTGEVSFINIFKFDNPELQDKIGIFVEELEANNITYDKQSYRPVNSIYVDQGKRKEILRSSASKRSQDRQTGGDLYSTLLKAIENDSKFEGVTTEEYYSGIEELKASETAAAQEVADLEADLESEFENDANVDFKLKEEQSKEGFTDVNEIVEAMSEDTDGAVVEITETNPNAPKIDVQELNERLKKDGGRPMPIVSIDVIDGIPTMFSISDQLRTGNVVNPSTGKVIKNLKGGLGFNGVKGHENLAWASIDTNTVKGQISTATKIYNNNKELFKNWWAANPEYNGLVPMSIVKMETDSILSNEAVVRVMADNISSFPKAQRVEALNVFRERLETKKTKLQQAIKDGVGLSGNAVKPSTLKQYAEQIKSIEDVQKMDKKVKAKTIDGLLTPKALKNLKAITSVNIITGNLGYGKPNSPTGKAVKPGTPSNPVAKALLGENPSAESKAKLHLGSITDVLTEPQLKNTPVRSVFTITGIDVLNPGIEKTNHPNYPVGPRGKIIGVIEQPQSVLELFPSAYNNAVLGKANENAGKNRKRSDKKRLSEVIPVQMGMTNREFQGTIVGVTEEGRLLDFMNRSFPFVNISTDQATMNQLLESPDVTAYLRGDSVVYGMTKDGNIFINKEVHDSKSELYNTAIHEMGHVWVKHLSLTPKGKKIYKRGAEIVQQTELYKKLLKRFDGDVNKATEEAMATLIGNRGESVVDASLKQQVKDWITAVWDYVRQEFKLSKDLTTKEIQDLTMDEFLGTAMADIFSGKPIKLTDAQLKTFSTDLKEAMLKSDQSMASIIETGRRNGYSDASIKAVLKERKFPAADIAAAMEVKVDVFTQLPEAFGRVEGGVSEGMKLYSEVRQAVSNFASKGKTMAEVRQKAMDLMKANPIYQAQQEQVQMELMVDFDKTLNSRANVSVQKEISAIRNSLKQRKISEKNLRASQTQLKNFIRNQLPKSKTYTQAQINKLISRVGKSTVDTFQADTEYVMNIVDKQKANMQKALVKDILKLVKSKAMTAFTKSRKRRAKGLSKEGQSYFNAVKQVLMADADTLLDIQQKIQENSVEISNLIQRQLDLKALTKADQKTEAGKDLVKKLTLDQKEQALLNLALAFDTFGDVSNLSLEETQALMQQIKDTKAESIAVFKSRRLARAEANKKMKEEADAQIKDTNPLLFDEDGNVLNENQRLARRDKILSHFRNFELGKGFSTLAESMRFSSASSYIKNFKLMLQHLGTLSNTLDRVTKGRDFFTKNVYDALNRMDDISIGGVYQTRQKLDDIANTIPGITKGMKQIYRKLNTGTHELVLRRGDTGTEYTDIFNSDQMMRIYALSLNDVQRQKLEAQGITPETIESIKNIIGPEAVEFAEKSVDFLSNEYYESVNNVYSYVNDVNLGYVNNYFPTSTISADTSADMIKGGDFNGVFNSETSPAFKERSNKTSDINLKKGDFTSVLNNHIESMEKYKAYAVGTQRLNNLFKIESVKALLKETGVEGAMRKAVNFAINPDSGKDASGTVKIISKLQSKFTGFALAFKAIQILKQATSFVNAFEDYSYFPSDSKVPRVIRKAVDYPMFMIDGAANVLSLAKDLVGMKGPVRQAMEISPTFRKRIEQGIEGDIYGLESGSQTFNKKSLTGSKRKRIQQGYKTAAAAPTVIGDVLGVMGYMINYKRNIKNGMSKADALKAFNNYNPTQQSRRGTDKIPLQMNSTVFQRAFTMFGSTLFLQINKVMQSTTNISRSISQGKMPRSKDTRGLALNMAVANVLFVGVSNIAKFVKGDDEDKEAALKKMAEAAMGLNLIYQLPFVGSAIEGFDVAGRVISGIQGEEYKEEGLRFSDDVVNPIASVFYKYKKLTKKDVGEVEAALRVLTEITVGAQFDPFIGLYNLFGGEEEKLEEATYDVTGISPSYRPKNEGGETYTPMSKTKMKQMFPEMYKDKYGPGGTNEDAEEIKSEIRKMKRDLKKEIYDDF